MFDKSNFALICIFGCAVGFLWSEMILSSSTFLLGINAIRDVPPRRWLRNKWWLMALGWVALYALSYFWSEDKHIWGIRLQTKLPFLLLPLALAYMPRFAPRQLQVITIILGCMFLVSGCYSLFFFISQHDVYIKAYQYSHLLPTLPDDHVRVSLATTLFITWCVYVWPHLQGRGTRLFTGLLILFLVAFMHVLAARSGLAALYLFLVAWGIYFAFARRRIVGVMVLVAIPVIFKLAMVLSPTFEQRVSYTNYGWSLFKMGDKSGNYGDANRLMSYKVAASIIKDHPLTGVGTGDMLSEMTTGYHQHYPEVVQEAVLLPHNQFLIVALGCGIPAALIFTMWVLWPLTRLRRNRESFFAFIVWLLLLFQLFIEPVLEVQYGVFVYLFFLVLQMNELPRRAADSVAN